MAEPPQQCSEKALLHLGRSGPKCTRAAASLEPNSLMVAVPLESVHIQHQDSQLLDTILVSSATSMSIQLTAITSSVKTKHQCDKENMLFSLLLNQSNPSDSIQKPRGKKMYLLLNVLMVYEPTMKKQINFKTQQYLKYRFSFPLLHLVLLWGLTAACHSHWSPG